MIEAELLLFAHFLKGSVQWKNDLGLYCSLVLVVYIGMYNLISVVLVTGDSFSLVLV